MVHLGKENLHLVAASLGVLIALGISWIQGYELTTTVAGVIILGAIGLFGGKWALEKVLDN